MKYIITILLLTLSLSVNARGTPEQNIRTAIICEEGYRFLLVWVEPASMRPPSVVQIFEENGARPPQPIKCK